jgi:hypothetical protein
MIEEKTDYSPVVEETGEAEKRRERRKLVRSSRERCS